MKNNYKNLLFIVLSFGLFSSCSEEDLDPTLAQDKSIEISINTANDLQAVLNGAYDYLSDGFYYGRDIIILGEVFSDNTTSNANSNRFVDEAAMQLLPTDDIPESLWLEAYSAIASSNIVISAEAIEGDPVEIDHLKGQAHAIRAMAHFDLVKFYGQQHVNGGDLSSLGVPYVTKFRDNDALFPSRNSVQEVRDMAYADLDTAATIMSAELNGSSEFITTFGVDAIKARIANYFGDTQIALKSSNAVIESGEFKIAAETEFIANFAIDNTANSIFEIAVSSVDNPGINGLANIYQAGSYGDVIALPNLVAIYDEGDIRGLGGIITTDDEGTYRNTGKYPTYGTYDDNISVIRYAEIVLIYAEALLKSGNAPEALTWLNKIPANRGANLYAAATMDNILLERRKELAFEGMRFHDLARTMHDIPNPDPIPQTHEGPDYGSYNYALPIPSAEVETNSNVVQNFGY